MVDETTDVANQEQVVFCFRWIDNKLEAHEEFVGLCQVECTQAEMLVAVIHDVFKRLNISTLKLRGKCHDGASSMRGSRSGVKLTHPEFCSSSLLSLQNLVIPAIVPGNLIIYFVRLEHEQSTWLDREL